MVKKFSCSVKNNSIKMFQKYRTTAANHGCNHQSLKEACIHCCQGALSPPFLSASEIHKKNQDKSSHLCPRRVSSTHNNFTVQFTFVYIFWRVLEAGWLIVTQGMLSWPEITSLRSARHQLTKQILIPGSLQKWTKWIG